MNNDQPHSPESYQLEQEAAEEPDGARESVPEPAPGPAPAARPATTSYDDLLNGPIDTTLWRMAVPMTLGFLINAVYSWTDMYFVSRIGDTAVASLGFSDQIMFVVFTLGSGFSIGTGIVIARRIGEGRRREAEQVATESFTFMALYAALLALAISQILPSVLDLMRLHGELREDTNIFVNMLLFGLPANLLTFQMNATLRSTGNTVFPMTVLIVSAVVNAILAPILIFGFIGIPPMGVRGAGIATATAQWSAAVVSMIALYSGRLNLKLGRPTLRFDWSIIRTIFGIGVAASLQGIAVSATRLVILSIVNSFGAAAVTAQAIGARVDVLVFMPVYATGIAIETLVGHSIGAGRLDRVKKFRTAAIRDLGLLMIAAGAVIYFLADDIARIFTSDPTVIETTVHYLHIAVFGYIFFSIGQAGTRSLAGAGHSLRSMAINMVMLFVFQIPLALILSRYTSLGVSGVFAGIALGYLAFALLSTLAVRGDGWMQKKI